jgi:hypothetical protein
MISIWPVGRWTEDELYSSRIHENYVDARSGSKAQEGHTQKTPESAGPDRGLALFAVALVLVPTPAQVATRRDALCSF